MKKLTFLVSFTLIITTAFSQTSVAGTYSAHDPYNWCNLKLNADSSFVYSTWTCGGGGESKGKYKINEKLITLKFSTTDTLKNFSTQSINCDSCNYLNFCAYQFKFKSGETHTYKIKKCNTKEIRLTVDTSKTTLIRLFRQ